MGSCSAAVDPMAWLPAMLSVEPGACTGVVVAVGDVVVELSVGALCAPAPMPEVKSPVSATPTTTRPGSRYRLRSFLLMKRSSVLSAGLQEEEAAEDADPHEVDEVPVVTDRLVDVRLPRVPRLPAHPPQQEQHGDEAERHVQTVDARHHEEQRPVGVEPRSVARRREVVPLVEGVGQERQAHYPADPDPGPCPGAVAAFLCPHAEL